MAGFEHITAKTRLVGVAGYRIGYTLSPVMHNAAFRALDLNYVYVTFDIQPHQVEAALHGIRALGIAGLNVTKPHKAAVIPYLDEVSETARTIDSVNTIVNREGRLYGYTTDGRGLLRALAELGFEPAGQRVTLLGAGGAGRAIAVALAQAGVAELVVVNRTLEKAEALADQVGGMALSLEGPAWADAVARSNLLINAVSSDVPLYEEAFYPNLLVYDTRYDVAETALMKAARARGARVANGLNMLLYQGVESFALWTGVAAPVPTMRQALQKAWQARLNTVKKRHCKLQNEEYHPDRFHGSGQDSGGEKTGRGTGVLL